MPAAFRARVVIASRLYVPEVTAAAFRMAAVAESLTVAADVEVVTSHAPVGAGIAPAIPGVRVARAPVLRDRSGAIRGYLQYASFDVPLFFRLLFRHADAIIAEAPPTTGLVALVVARLKRVPLVYYPGDVWSDGVVAMGASAPVVGLMRWMESTVARAASLILAVSPEVGKRFEALGAAPERITLVGNGIDTEIFRPRDTIAPADRPYFVYTGTMSEWQQPDVFIRALRSIDPDVELRFFGQGAVEDDLRRLADEIVPGRVHFGGVVGPAVSAEWIRGSIAALVSIVPGIGYDFARPTKTYAAAACGVPVLYAGAETGAALVREAGLGEAVGFDVDEVADAMRALIDQHSDGTSDRRRPARSAWARAHVSLDAVGARAATASLGAIQKTSSDYRREN